MTLKPTFKGRLIAIGGNEDKQNELVVLKRVVKEIRKRDFKVAVLTTATEEPEQRAKEYREVFTSLGATEIKVLDIRERSQANEEAHLKTLEESDLIFIVGGNQLRLTAILGGSKVLASMSEQLKKGTLIAGTSAGAAAFSDAMIYEGVSEEGLIKGGVLTTSGFGFVENIIFDTHFMARGRFGRLVQIVTTNPTCTGVGLGEDSGVILSGDGEIEVIGSGQVIVVDGSEINHSNIISIEPGGSIAVENIRIHSLAHGYRYNFKERKFITPSVEKLGAPND
ncbi:MAG: cyanophycinase [Candidatus Marinamargulisbacteria bacterium]|jgi:cyanophycinase